MSRCFPFPPPGYERKSRTDDLDVLKKEKERVKKDKKDKKEKKEKEKREKDRSDGKHRETRDKKEKNRDKKKDKESNTDKVKDRPGTSYGTRLPEKFENHVTEKIIHKDDRDKRDGSQVGGSQAEKFGQNSHLPAETRNSVSMEVAKKTKGEVRGNQEGGYRAEKLGQNSQLPAESRKPLLPDMAQKTKAKDEIKGSQVGSYRAENIGQKSQLSGENRNSLSVEAAWKTKDEARGSQVGAYQAEKLGQNRLPVEHQNSVSMEVVRKIKDEARGVKNQLAEKSSDHKTDVGTVKFVAKGNGVLAQVKEPNKDKRVDIRKPDMEEVRGAPPVGGSAMVQKSGRPAEVPGGMVHTKVQGLHQPLESNAERKIDGKEKTKEKEGDEKRGQKRKDKDREKKSHGKDKDRDREKKKEEKAKKKNSSKTAEPDKEKKKEEKANEKNGTKHAEPEKSRETIKETPIDGQYSKPSQPSKISNKTANAEGDSKKRKDLTSNGALHADETRPNKLLRPSSSPHILTQNGRTLESGQTPISYVSDMHEGAHNVKVNSKDHKKNGFIEAKPLSVSPAKPRSKAAVADPFAEASNRPPHPDSARLSKIYTVPKMNELADDDQDWLFDCCTTKSKKPKVESLVDEDTTEVWSEALRIESADICALPYVIPY